MVKFNILTVPHSGTRFLMNFLHHCSFHRFKLNRPHLEPEDYVFGHFWYDSKRLDCLDESYYYERNKPIVCTLRHPHEVAVSWVSREKRLSDMLGVYRQFVMFAENRDVLLFDIACPEKYRESKLREMLEHCKVYETRHDDTIKRYAEEWKIVGSHPSIVKERYQLQNTLPKYDWKRFNGLTKWYDEKIREFNYDNIT